jgi:error-prone DNA polymerase
MAAWKKSGRLLRHRERLFRGFARRGIPRKFSEALFEQIKGFGEYGFPESHAASFALLVYTSAWLKTHYPAHFVGALLNSQPMGFYSPSALVQDARRHGVEVRDVCAMRSDWDSTLEQPSPDSSLAPGLPGRERALRLGLRLIQGLSKASVERWLWARSQKPWQSLDDLVERSGIRRDELGALAQAGALEALVSGRRQALWAACAPRVPGLFRGRALSEPKVSLPALGPLEQLVLDYEKKGLSVHDHPLAHLRPILARQKVVTARELVLIEPGCEVRVAGLVTCRQQPYTAKGVVFLTLEDETGSSNLILRPHIFARYRREALGGTLLLARGRVQRVGGRGSVAAVVHVLASSLERVGAPGLVLPRQSRDFC